MGNLYLQNVKNALEEGAKGTHRDSNGSFLGTGDSLLFSVKKVAEECKDGGMKVGTYN